MNSTTASRQDRAYHIIRKNSSRVPNRIKYEVIPEEWAMVVELEGHLQDQILIALNLKVKN